MQRSELGGVFLPVTTPFDGAGEADLAAFRSNLAAWMGSPVSGVLVAGSTGESVLLDEAERQALLEVAREALGERVLIAGTGAESTRATVRLSRQAAEAGADAVLVSPPAYYKGAMSPAVLAGHYRAVADESPVPVIVYQVPLRLSTLDLPTGLVAELSRHENVFGIKDSRGKLDLVGELLDQCADGFRVLVGNGALLHAALQMGAAGGIVAAGLLATAESAAIAEALAEGRTEEAGRIQERIAPAHVEIVAGMGVAGIKAGLDLLGLHGGPTRAPLPGATQDQEKKVREVLEGAGLLQAAAA